MCIRDRINTVVNPKLQFTDQDYTDPDQDYTDPNLDQVKHLGFHITNQKIPRIVPGHLRLD